MAQSIDRLSVGMGIVCAIGAGLICYFAHQDHLKALSAGSDQDGFTLPQVPRLESDPAPPPSNVNLTELWRMAPPKETSPSSQDNGTPASRPGESRFIRKTIEGIETLVKVGNARDRWQFHGVVRESRTAATLGVFHNPSRGIGFWLLTGPGDPLEPGLTVADIGDTTLTVRESIPEGDDKLFDLKVFRYTSPE